MAHRIEVSTRVNDSKSAVMLSKLQKLNFPVTAAKVVDIYTINRKLTQHELEAIAQMLANPVVQEFSIDSHNSKLKFDYALEIGFLPGVTDNVAHTAKESIEDLLKVKFNEDESVHSSQLTFLSGDLNQETVQKIGETIANSLIQRIHIKDHAKYASDQGMDTVVPKVKLGSHPHADEVEMHLSDEELIKLGKEGVPNEDGSRRGPLTLSLDSLHTIQKYFHEEEKRNPNDIELEAIAQTWSEHCKHTIFASEIDEVKDGLYKHYIKRATQDVRKAKGDDDFCVSVFSDNSGGIIFDENWVITDKAETHNSPSALDPFGGAITGIVGVNRDTMGFGQGAKPVINKYGFCVGYPDDQEAIYRDSELTNHMLPPKRILEGVIAGVKSGGNESGIPTPQGYVYFHDGFKGKPLVFVGTIGVIPKEINGKPSWEKSACPGDKVVVIGGRVGQDGIHGATFSSEALTSGSPATAVQIGDPITQKKVADAILTEARNKGLYNSITDNGAGGISCSVAEMARECGGCHVQLDKVPLKYPNLEPWQIWISESQERITLAVPPSKLDEFLAVMEKYGVESAVIGEFNDSGRCQVEFNGEMIMDMQMDFLHDGLPPKKLTTSYTRPLHPEPDFTQPSDLGETLQQLLARPNIASYEFISRMFDHNVLGGSVLKPLQGKGEVNALATVTKPFINTQRGIATSQVVNPAYSEIDTYHMAACAIDTAIRNLIACGANLDHMALMDNFCWCSSDEAERLGQLKAAAEACYDYAVAYGTPYISGKDSMFNDFKGFDADGKAIKISIPPTLMASATSVIADVSKAISLDPKMPGDLVYILGETKKEIGASEYIMAMGKNLGNSVPQVDSTSAIKLYRKFMEAADKRLIASALSPYLGGLGITLAKKAIAGQLGLEIDLQKVPGADKFERDDYLLFSESQSRIVVTIDPARKEEFEQLFADIPNAQIGTVTEGPNFRITGLDGSTIIDSTIPDLDKHYRQTFKNF